MNDDKAILQSNLNIIPSEQAEDLIEQKTNSTGTDTVLIDNEESILISLDDITPTEEDKDIKLVVIDETVSEDTQEITIQYETTAPYTTEEEIDEDDTYEKKVTVKSDSAIHYENVRSYSTIPEEYVLQGIPFELDWLINGTKVNVIDDERFDVQFADTDGNGLIDTMSWIVPQLSEKVFSINADTSEADEIDNVPSKLELMQEKLDGPFYDKTIQMVNAKVMGELDEYLIEDRNLNGTATQIDSESLQYYDVIILPNLDGYETGDDVKDIIKQNQQKIKQNLESNHNARNVFAAERLSFVTAQIPTSEIGKLSEYGEVRIVGDGEIRLAPELDISKQVINSDVTLNGQLLTGNGVTVAVIDTGMSHDLALPELEKIIDHTYCRSILGLFPDCADNESGEDSHKSFHGTHVAGIVGGYATGSNAEFSGVATGVDILNVKYQVIDLVDSDSTKASILAHALEWSLAHGADIINLSQGFSHDNSVLCSSSTYSILVDEVVDEGVLFVKSAGNIGHVAGEGTPSYQTITDPGCGFNVISVGNLNDQHSTDSSSHYVYYTSSKGPTPDIGSTDYPADRLKPEIVAPGHAIKSAGSNNGYTDREPILPLSGTSLAAPHISGAAAILLETQPQYTPLEIKSALLLGASWHNPDKIDPALPLTANTYEFATEKLLDESFDIENIDPQYKDHHLLNEWGFGLLNVEQSINYATNFKTDQSTWGNSHHIIRDSYGFACTDDSCTSREPLDSSTRQYTFAASSGEEIRIILSWLYHPFTSEFSIEDPDTITGFQISNLDLEVSGPGLEDSLESNSEIQNNEFIVFEAPSSGIYTVSVIPKTIYPYQSQAETYTISATKKLTPLPQPANHPPTFQVIKPAVLDSGYEIPFTMVLTPTDQDGDAASFFVTEDPKCGMLSSIRQFHDFTVLGYLSNDDSSDDPDCNISDTFSIKAWDGRDFGAENEITIEIPTNPSGSEITENSILTSDQEYTLAFETKGAETLDFPSPDSSAASPVSLFSNDPIYRFLFGNVMAHASDDAVSSIKASVTAVNGAVLEYTADSKTYKQFIPPHSNKLIEFPEPKIISDVKVHKHLSQSDEESATIGYTFGDITEPPPPIDNYPPTARITVSPDGIVDELTTVTLDGITSSDHETETADLQYKWSIFSNSVIDPISLSSDDEPIVTFRAPSYDTHPTREFITIQLTVTDEGGLSHTTRSTVTVESVPENTDNPIARNDAYRVPSDTDSHSLDVLENDHPDRNSLTIHAIGTTGTAGTTTISTDSKSINYIPCTDCTNDSFTYTVSDGASTSTAGLVTITVGNDYTLHVTSWSSQDIRQYDSAATYIDDTLEWSRDYPTSMAFGGGDTHDDYMYVALNNDELHRYDAHTGIPYGDNGDTSDSEVWQFGDDINILETGPDRHLYVSTDGGKIYRFDVRENPTHLSRVDETFDSSLNNPSGMTFDGTERLYVADLDAETIYRYDSSGTRSTFVSSGSGGMEKPYDIAFDSQGNLFVSSEDAEEIYRFTSDGTPYRFSGDSSSALFSDEDLDSPRGIIITPDDRLLVANERDDNILEFSPYDGSPTHMPEPDIFASRNGLDGPYDVVIGSAVIQNNAPSIDHISDQAVSENGSLAVDIVATDPDGDDSIVLSLPTKPSFVTLQDNGDGTGTITLTPDYSDSGTYAVTVSASDGTDSDSQSFSVTVYDVNRPPIMEPIPDVIIEAGVTGAFLVTATDPDGDTLSYGVVQQNNPPPYLTITTNANGTATVTVSPPEDTEPMSLPVTISVTDNGTPILSDDSTFTLGVAAAETCGMEITSGDAVSFGTVDPSEISSESIITIQNTGNVDGTVSVSGTDWTDEDDTIVMNAGTTKYSVTSGNYGSKISLSETPQDVATIDAENILDIFLQLQADLLDSLFSGELSQDIEVNMAC